MRLECTRRSGQVGRRGSTRRATVPLTGGEPYIAHAVNRLVAPSLARAQVEELRGCGGGLAHLGVEQSLTDVGGERAHLRLGIHAPADLRRERRARDVARK